MLSRFEQARLQSRIQTFVELGAPEAMAREYVDLYVDPDTTGVLVEDCAVCCRPWTVTIERTMGKLRVQVSRAQ